MRFRTFFLRTKSYTTLESAPQSDGDNAALRIARENRERLIFGLRSSRYSKGAGLLHSREVRPTRPMEKQTRKDPRRKVFKDGKIVSHQLHGAVDVRIRNLSESGALIELPIGTLVPDTFELLIVWAGMLYPARMRWRKADRRGVEFTGPAKHVALRTW